MFSNEWLSMLLQFLILVPGALSCYLPVQNQMRFSEGKTLALCCLAAVLFSFAAACAVTAWDIDSNLAGNLCGSLRDRDVSGTVRDYC